MRGKSKESTLAPWWWKKKKDQPRDKEHEKARNKQSKDKSKGKSKANKWECWKCGQKGRYKAQRPKRQEVENKPKEIVLTVLEAMIIEPTKNEQSHAWFVPSNFTDMNSFFLAILRSG